MAILLSDYSKECEGNILTFNSGWHESATPLHSFDDVRKIQYSLQKDGIEMTSEADPRYFWSREHYIDRFGWIVVWSLTQRRKRVKNKPKRPRSSTEGRVSKKKK